MTDPGSDQADLRFAWYGRLSTDELQQPQLAFPSQRAACERRVSGIGRIVCEFTDVESGRSDDRAGIEALFAEAGRADRRFDAVVTYKAERFARRMVLALAYEEELRLANISIYVSDEVGEPGRPTSVLTRRIKQAVGEWYVLELVEESRRGMEENTRQGFNTGGIAPYGYRKRFLPHPARSMADRGKHKVVLEPDPAQVPVVERIFREFVFGEGGIRGIASDLNRDGVPSARGGPWSGAAVSGILDNPKYTGFQVWNRAEAEDRRQPDERGDGVGVVEDAGSPGDHPPRTLEGCVGHAAPTRDRLASPTEVGPARQAPSEDGFLPLQPPDGRSPKDSPDQGVRLVLGVPELQGAHPGRSPPDRGSWGPGSGAPPSGPPGGFGATPAGPPSGSSQRDP